MKFLKITILFLSFHGFSQEVLTNQSVIQLIQAKVSPSIIIEKIKVSPNNFKLNTQGILELLFGKVNERTIDAMLQAAVELPILKNQDIIDMYGNRVPKIVILKKIQYSENKFDTNSDALVNLKQATIPDQIVKMMINPQKIVRPRNYQKIIADTLNKK